MAVSEHTIVVFESRPRWEPTLKWELVDRAVRVRACRSWSELTAVVNNIRRGFESSQPDSNRNSVEPTRLGGIVIDPTNQVEGFLSWLTTHRKIPNVPLIVICADELKDLEWTWRDAGVTEVLVGDVAPKRLAQLCGRSFR